MPEHASVIVRKYSLDARGETAFRNDAANLGAQGYVPQTQSQDRGHIHLGRLLLTGGWSVLAGRIGIRSEGALIVTFVRTTPRAAPTIARKKRAEDDGWRPRGGYFDPRTNNYVGEVDGDGASTASPTPSRIDEAEARVPDDDLVAKLERLAKLRTSGALSDEEFRIAKSRLLTAEGDEPATEQ